MISQKAAVYSKIISCVYSSTSIVNELIKGSLESSWGVSHGGPVDLVCKDFISPKGLNSFLFNLSKRSFCEEIIFFEINALIF